MSSCSKCRDVKKAWEGEYSGIDLELKNGRLETLNGVNVSISDNKSKDSDLLVEIRLGAEFNGPDNIEFFADYDRQKGDCILSFKDRLYPGELDSNGNPYRIELIEGQAIVGEGFGNIVITFIESRKFLDENLRAMNYSAQHTIELNL